MFTGIASLGSCDVGNSNINGRLGALGWVPAHKKKFLNEDV